MNFLEHTAQELYNSYHDRLHRLAIVFPNRRQSVFFKNYFSQIARPPAFLPQLLTIEELIQLSSIEHVADPLLQNMELYKAYQRVCTNDGEKNIQGFEQFFPIAETLLKDFREIDTYLLQPAEIFQVLFNLEAIEKSFELLSEEQKTFLKRFWSSLKNKNKYQDLFLKLWKRLPETYRLFHEQLHTQHLTTLGMMYRQLATGQSTNPGFSKAWDHVAFVGFNALNKAEEEIIYAWQQTGFASIWQDTDAWYINNTKQEAGFFLRKNLKETGLVNRSPMLDVIGQYPNPINLISASGDTMQAKMIADWIATKKEGTAAIILADEKLLLPVLQSIPGNAGPVNVTMGYPMQQSVLYSFFTLYFDIQTNISSYKYRYLHFSLLQKWLYHPLCDWTSADKIKVQSRLLNENLLRVDTNLLKKKSAITALLLSQQLNITDICKTLRQVLELVHQKAIDNGDQLLQAAASAGWQSLQALYPILDSLKPAPTLEFIAQVIKKHFGTLNIALEGEPLKGVQVMGLLESRALDFDHILLLGASEGTLPRINPPQSFLPDAVRRAFGLPVAEYQDAIFAYTFYRLLHRSKSMTIVYNALVSDDSTGEASRFIQQLQFETNIHFNLSQPATVLKPNPITTISIEKNEVIQNRLSKYFIPGKAVAISASAINTYLNCRLQFFFKYIAGLKKPDELSEEIDAGTFGSLVHKLMEFLYADIKEKQGNHYITEDSITLMRTRIPALFEKAFDEVIGNGGDNTKKELSGIVQVIREVAIQYANGFLDQDAAYTPFDVENLEVSFLREFPIYSGSQKVFLKGVIDRVDKKNDLYRMVDYKTGSDKTEFDNIELLFDRDGKAMNKAALQTLIYSWMFQKEFPERFNFQPALIPLRALQTGKADTRLRSKAGNVFVEAHTIHPYLLEVEEHLRKLIEEIFDPAVNFDQTADLRTCSFCDYAGICNRG